MTAPRSILLIAPLAGLLIACAAGFTACSDDSSGSSTPTSAPQATQPDGSTTPNNGTPNANENLPGVIAAREQMATSFDSEPSAITLVSVEEATFSDACLDVTPLTPGTPEVCAQVITPGYVITLQLGTTVATYHSDESGTNVRFADVTVGGGPNEIDVP